MLTLNHKKKQNFFQDGWYLCILYFLMYSIFFYFHLNFTLHPMKLRVNKTKYHSIEKLKKKNVIWTSSSNLTDHLIFEGIINYPSCFSFVDSRTKLLFLKTWLPNSVHETPLSFKFLFLLCKRIIERNGACEISYIYPW